MTRSVLPREILWRHISKTKRAISLKFCIRNAFMDIMTHAKFYFNRLMLTLIFVIRASEPPPRAWRTTEKAGLDRVKISCVSISEIALSKDILEQFEPEFKWCHSTELWISYRSFLNLCTRFWNIFRSILILTIHYLAQELSGCLFLLRTPVQLALQKKNRGTTLHCTQR